ncbi:hypothetical protein FDP41_010532 [Naegleria fowleri]|uniref:Guanine nucleotide-binding protein subunit beta-like protein n=1 Tax=Naegleria fowleri TaxID=5763 RepID=A0A6A5C247_NAEFO|nr:uncharacterized protein FDP41_010532 [Naegleria fowleri]KAF0983467.1 hypothetical protein FDP41_010532 [Naegleria fowleri]CAG4715265.1 unnamed protein product [Naegleria fowleri]
MDPSTASMGVHQQSQQSIDHHSMHHQGNMNTTQPGSAASQIGGDDFGGYTLLNYETPKIPHLLQTAQLDVKPILSPNIGILEGLSKPATNAQTLLNTSSTSLPTLFLCGTENQTPNVINPQQAVLPKNCLLFGRIDPSTKQPLPLKLQNIEEHVRYIEWLPKDPRRIVVAMNAELGIVVLNPELDEIQEIDTFPKFHQDTIRQFAINPVNQSLVISGGFDEKVFVTDISKLVDDIQSNQMKSENSVYLCQDVVSSVRFHPSDSNVASATTDQGVLHVFDVRTGNTSKPAFVYDTGKIELFTHTYLDDFTVCLGYGDGQIQVHDIRTGRSLLNIVDKCLSVVGDFHYEPNKRLLISLGMPKFSLYQVTASSFEVLHAAASSFANTTNPGPTVTHGTYIPQTSQFLTTDNYGMISLYDL